MSEVIKYKRKSRHESNTKVFYFLLLIYAISTTIAIILLVSSVNSLDQQTSINKSKDKLTSPILKEPSNPLEIAQSKSEKTPNKMQDILIYKPHSQAPFNYRANVQISTNFLRSDQELNLVNEIIQKTGIPSRLSKPTLTPIRNIFRQHDLLIVDLHSDMMPLVDGWSMTHLQNTYTIVHSLLEYSQLPKLKLLFGGGRLQPLNSQIDFTHFLKKNSKLIKELK